MKLHDLFETDDKLRAAKRDEEMGDSSAPGKLLMQRVRVGQVQPKDVQTAASLGYPAAVEIFPNEKQQRGIRLDHIRLLSRENIIGFSVDCAEKFLSDFQQTGHELLAGAIRIARSGGGGWKKEHDRLIEEYDQLMRNIRHDNERLNAHYTGFRHQYFMLARGILELFSGKPVLWNIASGILGTLNLIDHPTGGSGGGPSDWRTQRYCQYLLGEASNG